MGDEGWGEGGGGVVFMVWSFQVDTDPSHYVWKIEFLILMT